MTFLFQYLYRGVTYISQEITLFQWNLFDDLYYFQCLVWQWNLNVPRCKCLYEVTNSAMFQIVSEDCKENIHKQVSKTWHGFPRSRWMPWWKYEQANMWFFTIRESVCTSFSNSTSWLLWEWESNNKGSTNILYMHVQLIGKNSEQLVVADLTLVLQTKFGGGLRSRGGLLLVNNCRSSWNHFYQAMYTSVEWNVDNGGVGPFARGTKKATTCGNLPTWNSW